MRYSTNDINVKWRTLHSTTKCWADTYWLEDSVEYGLITDESDDSETAEDGGDEVEEAVPAEPPARPSLFHPASHRAAHLTSKQYINSDQKRVKRKI